jgi:hypothetical protein
MIRTPCLGASTLAPTRTRCCERLLLAAARNRTSIVAGRRAVLTREHNGQPVSLLWACTPHGCDIGAFFNSSDYLIEPALRRANSR